MNEFTPVETHANIEALGHKTVYLHNKWLSYTLNQLKHYLNLRHQSKCYTIHNYLIVIKLTTYQSTGA